MPTTSYPYAVGKDPAYDAWLAQYNYQTTTAQQDAKLRASQNDEQYRDALTGLDQQGSSGRTNLKTSMLERGVYASGERYRRQADLEAALLQARGQADEAYNTNSGQIQSDLDRALTSLGLQQQQEISASMLRQQAGAGGGGGGRSSAGYTGPTLPKPLGADAAGLGAGIGTSRVLPPTAAPVAGGHATTAPAKTVTPAKAAPAPGAHDLLTAYGPKPPAAKSVKGR